MWRTHNVSFPFLQSVILSHHISSVLSILIYTADSFPPRNTYLNNILCDNYLILTYALYYKNLTETACKHASAAARNPECNASTNYAADVTSYVTTYSTQSSVHNTICNQQRTTEKAGKAARRGLCTCNHPARLTPLVRNRSQLFLSPNHQCYATSTHLQATRQRE